MYAVTDGSYLTSVPGCILSLSLSPHPSIARASHMIPPLLLVSPTDVIPGLVHSSSSEGWRHCSSTYIHVSIHSYIGMLEVLTVLK